MSNVMHETFVQLMGQIDGLEQQIEQLEQEQHNTEQVLSLKGELSEKQHELARISDGCGTPHHH